MSSPGEPEGVDIGLSKNEKQHDCNRMDWHERKSQMFLKYIQDQQIIEKLNPAITILYELPIKPEDLLEYFAEYFEDGAVSVIKLSLLKAELCYKRAQLQELKDQYGSTPPKPRPTTVPSSAEFLMPTPSTASLDQSARQSIQSFAGSFHDLGDWKQTEEMLHIASVSSITHKPLVGPYKEMDDLFDSFRIEDVPTSIFEAKRSIDEKAIMQPSSAGTIPGGPVYEGGKRLIKQSDKAKEYVRNVFAEEYKNEVLKTFPFEMLDDD